MGIYTTYVFEIHFFKHQHTINEGDVAFKHCHSLKEIKSQWIKLSLICYVDVFQWMRISTLGTGVH